MKRVVTVEKTFGKNGYQYRLVASHPSGVALYEQVSHHSPGVPVAWETLKVRSWAGLKAKFAHLNGTTRLPSNEEWGHYGWTFVSLAAAQRKYTELVIAIQKGTVQE